MLEPKAGVFVGTLSQRVRQRLWDRICSSGRTGSCVMIHRFPNEQGFRITSHGEPRRQIIDIEGLQLVVTPLTKRDANHT